MSRLFGIGSALAVGLTLATGAGAVFIPADDNPAAPSASPARANSTATRLAVVDTAAPPPPTNADNELPKGTLRIGTSIAAPGFAGSGTAHPFQMVSNDTGGPAPQNNVQTDSGPPPNSGAFGGLLPAAPKKSWIDDLFGDLSPKINLETSINLDTLDWSTGGPTTSFSWDIHQTGPMFDATVADSLADVELSLEVEFYKWLEAETPPTSDTKTPPSATPAPEPKPSTSTTPTPEPTPSTNKTSTSDTTPKPTENGGSDALPAGAGGQIGQSMFDARLTELQISALLQVYFNGIYYALQETLPDVSFGGYATKGDIATIAAMMPFATTFATLAGFSAGLSTDPEEYDHTEYFHGGYDEYYGYWCDECGDFIEVHLHIDNLYPERSYKHVDYYDGYGPPYETVTYEHYNTVSETRTSNYVAGPFAFLYGGDPLRGQDTPFGVVNFLGRSDLVGGIAQPSGNNSDYYTDRAFIQFAGFTMGRVRSFQDLPFYGQPVTPRPLDDVFSSTLMQDYVLGGNTQPSQTNSNYSTDLALIQFAGFTMSQPQVLHDMLHPPAPPGLQNPPPEGYQINVQLVQVDGKPVPANTPSTFVHVFTRMPDLPAFGGQKPLTDFGFNQSPLQGVTNSGLKFTIPTDDGAAYNATGSGTYVVPFTVPYAFIYNFVHGGMTADALRQQLMLPTGAVSQITPIQIGGDTSFQVEVTTPNYYDQRQAWLGWLDKVFLNDCVTDTSFYKQPAPNFDNEKSYPAAIELPETTLRLAAARRLH